VLSTCVSNKRGPTIPAPGSLVRLRVGATTVLATVIEFRGDHGRGPIIRVRFRMEGTAELADTEVPVDEVTLVESAH
jgi:hypothetical protein